LHNNDIRVMSERRAEPSPPPVEPEPEPGPEAGTETPPREVGGPKGPEPTRYGDWERNGRCYDF